jgi:hypothetical protein
LKGQLLLNKNIMKTQLPELIRRIVTLIEQLIQGVVEVVLRVIVFGAEATAIPCGADPAAMSMLLLASM